ncbi:MAG: hypothetical protein DMD99_10170 [Candidatus Rokuibacteriota bacterium]|nr:MAG: hypothetical protein DMD99_10170 [Candidatus Rokubacteria bacterium]
MDDVRLSHLCHAAIVRSPHAHARIVDVDARRATVLPGVVAVPRSPTCRSARRRSHPSWPRRGSALTSSPPSLGRRSATPPTPWTVDTRCCRRSPASGRRCEALSDPRDPGSRRIHPSAPVARIT